MMISYSHRILILCLLSIGSLLLYPEKVQSQFYSGSQLSFGKNRVQYGNFEWSYFQFERFDTYFYLNGKELAINTAYYATDQISELEKSLETTLEGKIQFIVFNNLTDLKQSNLGLLENGDQYNTGGVTRILDQKIILYNSGNQYDFKKQVRQGIITVLLNQMLYGSSLTSQVKNNTLLFLPDWYIKGLISYLAEDWNTAIDNRVRDGIASGRYKRFNQLSGQEAAYAGHSIWKFVADKYGKSVVSNILYMAKISKNVESGFMFVLGVSFKSIVKEWLNYYQARNQELAATDSLMGRGTIVHRSPAVRVISQVKITPDGERIAFTTNEAGQYKVFVKEITTGKSKRVLKRGYRLDDETDYSYPLLSWHPSGKLLSMITEEKGKTILYFYNLSNRKMDKRYLFQFDKVLDFCYSPDGKSFALSAVIKGQTDLFLFNIAANSFEQLTFDLYDDLNPRFLEGGSKIIFSSNRQDEQLVKEKQPLYAANSSDKYDLFTITAAKKSRQIRRITDTPQADERYPIESGKGLISYLSDLNGVFNRYLARFDSTIAYIDTTTHYRYFTVVSPLTHYPMSILEQDVSPATERYAEIIFHDNKYHIYTGEKLTATRQLPQALELTSYMQALRKESEKRQEDSLSQLKKHYQGRKKRFYNVRATDQESVMDTVFSQPGNKIDINNYVFEKQAFIKLTRKDSSETQTKTSPAIALPGESPLVIPKQLNYLTEYSINELVSQVDFNYLNSTYQPFSGGSTPIFLNPGFNALLQVGATDLMENYRITGGVRLSLSLVNNEYLLSFSNLRDRLDKEITFHRQAIESSIESPVFSLMRTTTHQLYYRLSWPFSEVLSARGTAGVRNDRTSYLSIDEQNLREPDVTRNWTKVLGELVFDATRSLGLNLPLGSKYKVFGEYYQQVENTGKSFFVLGIDARNYQRIHRTLIWANRFAASTSFGSNKLIYYMGGVDNWLAPKFNQDVPVSAHQSFAYQTLATNMRGFSQNIRNGNSFAVINSELRLPVFRYFANRPIKSDFINNFQVIAFGDIGTAWIGPGPYSRKNSLYQRVISQGPITVTIENQVEPIVGGYGFGLRTRFLGYFLRADWAWGVEDLTPTKGIFYLSLSLDF